MEQSRLERDPAEFWNEQFRILIIDAELEVNDLVRQSPQHEEAFVRALVDFTMNRAPENAEELTQLISRWSSVRAELNRLAD